ncbi:lipocalin family protein [Actibacterium ureilyticum]|uniref:lipocalin family protein n=1 Tax=Actibacterium ureilyticum TaxID=1590614 RepID=UPI000BAB059F|nr:lipocalin family protein [Actibacterium ureilyticum]
MVAARHILIAAMAVALWACAPAPRDGYRRADAPISSQAAVDLDRLAGTWTVVDGYAGAPLGVPGQALRIAVTDAGIAMTPAPGATRQLTRVAAGRFAAAGADPELWLLWADADYRIAVIGNPAGSLGFIMMREGAAGSGLRTAAREIFDWQGYDMARLVSVSP